jgi:L-idonate 5-dehydrogenase
MAAARALGATRTMLATEGDRIAAVQADGVVESSGSHRGLASAIRGATRGGRVVMVGLQPSGAHLVAITRELEPGDRSLPLQR